MSDELETMFPIYNEELVQRLREWMETGRYKRYSRTLDEFIIEQGYFVILKLLEMDAKLDSLVKTINRNSGNSQTHRHKGNVEH